MKNPLYVHIDSNRVFGLDVVRAAAILFVLLTHSGNFVPKFLIKYYKSILYDGVGIFFVLSGFLIGGILIKQIETYKFDLKSLFYFWVKRWSRTLPNYFLFLFALFIIESMLDPKFNMFQYWKYLFFSQNLTSASPNFFSHAWSLSVEEWFYLITPLLLLILMSVFRIKFKKSFLFIISLIIIGVTIIRLNYTGSIENTESYRNVTYSVLYRFDSLMYGMLGAYLAYYFPKFWNDYKKTALWLAIAMFSLYFLSKEILHKSNDFYYQSFVLSLTSLTVLLSLPYFSSLKTNKTFFFKPITYISIVSYSLYLVNSIVVQKIELLIDWERIINYVNSNSSIPLNWTFAMGFNYLLSWVLSFLIATIVYKYFEIPSTKYLRDKIKIKLEKI